MNLKDNKGFTLVELIATIIIISLIFIISFPSLYRILRDNSEKQYDDYYKLVREAAYVYAGTKKDVLGGSNDKGCVKTTVSDLVTLGLLKEFNNDDGTVSTSEISIQNKKGKFDIYVYIDFIDSEREHHIVGNKIKVSCDAFNLRWE